MVKTLSTFFILTIFGITCAFAQSNELEAQLKSNLPPAERLLVFEKLIEENKFDNRYQSLAYGKQAYQFANKQETKALKAKGAELLGHAYYLNFKYDSALLYFKEGLALTPNLTEQNAKLSISVGDTFWYNGQFDSSLVYYEKGWQNAKAVNNLNLLAILTINTADYYRQMGNFEKALGIYMEGIGYAQQDTSGLILPKAYNNTAMVYGYSGDSYTELEYYFKAVEASNKPELENKVGLFYANIAEVYASLGDYKNAFKYITIGIEKNKKANHVRNLMWSYEILGHLFMSTDSLPQAREAFEESTHLNKEVKDKRILARNLGNIASIERRLKNYSKAIEYFKEGIAIQKEIADNKFKIKNLLGLTQTYIDQNNLIDAVKSNTEVLYLAKSLGIRPYIAESYKLSSVVLEKQNNLKLALHFTKKYDSINSVQIKEERIKYLQNLERLQQVKLKELENLRLKKDMEIQTSVIDKQERLFKISTVMILVLLIVSFFIYSLLKKNQDARKKITHQNETLRNKNEEIQSISDQQENLLHVVMHDIRSPLNKIDGLANILRLEGGLSSSQKEVIGMIEDVTKKSKLFIKELLDTSQIQYRSRQPKKEYFDVSELLNEIKEEYTLHASQKEIELKCHFNLPDSKALSDRGLLYHIIINLLSNAIKYSPSKTQIQLRAWHEEGSLYIQIQDEGQGFTEEDKKAIYHKFQKLSAKPIGVETSTGLGLYLTKILVDSLNGKIALESKEQKGSTFTLSFADTFVSL